MRAIHQRGCRVIGDESDLLVERSPATAHPDDVSDSELVEVAAVAIEQMVRDVRDLTLERDELRARGRRRTPSRLRRLRRAGAGGLVRAVARRARAARRGRGQGGDR